MALAVTFAMAVGRSRSIDSLTPATLASQAADAIAGGDESVREWVLKTLNQYPELDIYFVYPDGRELRGRSSAQIATAFATKRMSGPFPATFALRRHGGTYRLAFLRTSSLAFDLWDILLEPEVIIVLSLLVSGLGAAWLASTVVGPVVRLREAVQEFASGNLAVSMGGRLRSRRDELGALARDFISMASRLRQVIESKEALLRDVSHELRSPLSRLRVASDAAKRDEKLHENASLYRTIDREVVLLDQLIGEILSFSRLGHGTIVDRKLVDIGELLFSVVEDARFDASPDQKFIGPERAAGACVLGDTTLLRVAFDNVLRNAIHFSPKDASITVQLKQAGEAVVVSISNDRSGVNEDALPHIFEPFYRTPDSSGLGLGLAIVQRIVALHDGELRARNTESGFEVQIGLKAVDNRSISVSTTRVAHSSSGQFW